MIYYCKECHRNWMDVITLFEWKYLDGKVLLKKCPNPNCSKNIKKMSNFDIAINNRMSSGITNSLFNIRKIVQRYHYKIKFNKQEHNSGIREFVTIKKISRFKRLLIKWIIGWKMELINNGNEKNEKK